MGLWLGLTHREQQSTRPRLAHRHDLSRVIERDAHGRLALPRVDHVYAPPAAARGHLPVREQASAQEGLACRRIAHGLLTKPDPPLVDREQIPWRRNEHAHVIRPWHRMAARVILCHPAALRDHLEGVGDLSELGGVASSVWMVPKRKSTVCTANFAERCIWTQPEQGVRRRAHRVRPRRGELADRRAPRMSRQCSRTFLGQGYALSVSV